MIAALTARRRGSLRRHLNPFSVFFTVSAECAGAPRLAAFEDEALRPVLAALRHSRPAENDPDPPFE